jgi:hypothetical protein
MVEIRFAFYDPFSPAPSSRVPQSSAFRVGAHTREARQCIADRRRHYSHWHLAHTVDTTVVETNIHYATDSSLLGDEVRVLPRTDRFARAHSQCRC